jgi:O-antigen/teichoic acid export membrane protein
MFLISKYTSSITQKLSPNFKKIIANTFWLFADRIVQMLLSLFIGIWVTRYLGPEQFGLLSYSMAFVSLFGVISNLGMDSIVVREVVRNSASANLILGTTFFLRQASTLVTALMAIAVIFVIRPEDPVTHTMVGILIISSFFNTFPIDVWYQSQVDSKHVVWARNSAYVLMCGYRLALIQMQAPLVAFAWAALVEVMLSTAAQVALYQFKHKALQAWRFNIGWAKTLLKESWPLIISGMVIVLYMRIDQLMLGQMTSAKEVGIYSAAVKISEMWYFVPGAIVSSVFPSIVQSRENSTLYYSRLQKLFNLMTLLSYGVALPLTFISTWLVSTLYGTEFMAAAPILSLHVWTGLFVSIGLARGPYLITEGLTRFSALTSAGGAVINIVLNYFLIPAYGAVGAAVATVIAQIFASYLAHLFHPQTRVIFVQQTRALFMVDYIQSVILFSKNIRT